jgi:hypothetical protein
MSYGINHQMGFKASPEEIQLRRWKGSDHGLGRSPLKRPVTVPKPLLSLSYRLSNLGT